MRLRVALCIFGHFRCFDKCYDNLKNNVLDPLQPDVFAHAWVDSTGYFLHPHVTPDPINHPGFDVSSPKPSMEYIKSVIDRVNPVDIHLDHYYLHDKRFADMVEKYDAYKNYNPAHRPKGTISLNYARSCAIAMKRQYELIHQFKYDRVIVTRWDIQHTTPFDLSTYDPNVLAVSNIHQVDDLIGDIFNISGSDIIDTFGEQVEGIDKLVEAGRFNLGAHEWMREWIEYNNIPWEFRNMGIWTDR